MNLLDISSPNRRSKLIVLCFPIYCACLCISPPPAPGGVEGAQVVNGQVSIQQNGNNTAITASDKAIINYSSFDIARPETVQFIQPNSSASVLNRILSADPTHIDGTLLANGRVFFVNPAGIYFGEGAQVNVSQLVASALNISDADFLDGRYHFASGDGSVINGGDISAEAVYLIGRQVANSGNISCPAGYVVMAAGDRVFLGEPGSDIVVEIDAPPSPDSADSVDPGTGVLNEGTVEAAGGIIALAAAGDLYAQAISNVGSLSTSVEAGEAGEISLTAAGGEVTNAGTMEAKSSSGIGGTVQMLGDKVGLFDAAEIDVSGSDGGGTVLVGGDYQGKGDVLTASRTYVGPDSSIKADATENGDGGMVVIWAEEIARFHGNISARGGKNSGDGGSVEVSGKQSLGFYGAVDTAAPAGEMGKLLLDPDQLNLVGGAGPGTLDGPPPDVAFGDGGAVESVSEAALEAVAADVTLEATSGITATTGTGWTSGLTMPSNTNLTLRTRNDQNAGEGVTGIDLTAAGSITLQGTGSLDVATGYDDGTAGYVQGSAPVTLPAVAASTGVVTVNSSGHVDLADVSTDGAVSIDGSSISASNDITGAGITLGAAATLNGAVDQRIDAVGGALLASSGITKTGAGTLTLGGATINLDGTVEVQSGALEIEDAFAAAADLEASTDVTLDGAATLNGAVDQRIDAVGGALLASSGITKTGAGTLTLGGATINLDGTVEVQSGNLALEANTTVASGQILRASGDVTLADGKTLTGTSSLTIEAPNGEIKAAGTGSTIGVSGSSLTLRQAVDLDLADFTFANQSSTDIALLSNNGSITAVDTASGGKDENAADQWQSVTATAQNSIRLQGTGSITTDALTSSGDGDLSMSDDISVHSTGGDLVVRGDIAAAEGGVSLIADVGTIYTPGGANDTLNVAITGYSHQSGGLALGVDLDPGGDPLGGLGDEGKAAIVIWNKRQDLKLGPDAVLTANGFYQAYDSATDEGVDDRASVDFRDEENKESSGDPIDVAIYVGSVDRDVTVGTGGNVEMGSSSVHINNAPGVGTLVIDAYDTVTFVDGFEDSLAYPRGDNVRRLEVVSRISDDLPSAVLGETLPHALDPAALADGMFLGTYVLRGSVILDSAVLGMTEPAPLVAPVPLELEDRRDMEDPDTEALVALLNELGIGVQPHLAGAYAGSLSTDLRLLGAAEKLQKLILTFEDADGTRSAALRTVVAQFFPTFDSFSDAQMDAFRQELARHSGDGTDYDLTGQILSALTTYVAILNTDVGWPMDKSVGFVMGRYVPQLTEGDDIRMAVVQMQLQLASGT